MNGIAFIKLKDLSFDWVKGMEWIVELLIARSIKEISFLLITRWWVIDFSPNQLKHSFLFLSLSFVFLSSTSQLTSLFLGCMALAPITFYSAIDEINEGGGRMRPGAAKERREKRAESKRKVNFSFYYSSKWSESKERKLVFLLLMSFTAAGRQTNSANKSSMKSIHFSL